MPALLLTCLICQFLSTHSCHSSGVCGGGCYQPAPISCQQSSCQPGYTCGPYGCARNKARSALTRKDGLLVTDDEFFNATLHRHNIFGVVRNTATKRLTPRAFEKLTNPNFLFRQCCEDRHLPDACLGKCHFNSYNREVLQEMFFKNDPCPIEAAADLQYCAAQGRDHRECCSQFGVHNTIAGERCMIFCDQRPDRLTKLSWDYLPCYDRFESMKRCFYDDSKAIAEKRFRPFLDTSAALPAETKSYEEIRK